MTPKLLQTYSICFILVLTFTVSGFTSINTEYTFRKYTILDGLPQMQVTHLMQDAKGYIWASNWNGISKFDGDNFYTLSKEDGLCDHAAFYAIEYQNDSLAIISPNGISTGNKNGFRSIKFPANIRGERNSTIYTVADKRLLITNLLNLNSDTYTHLFYNLKTDRFSPFTKLDTVFIHEVTDLKNSDGFRCYTNSSAFDFSFSGFKTAHRWTRNYTDFSKLPSGGYFAYCNKDEKLYKITTDNKEITTDIILPNANSVDGINMFTALNQERVVYYDDNFELFISSPDKILPVGRKFNLIRNFLTDREGNLWLATEEGIFNFFNFAFSRIKLFDSDFSDMVWSIAQTDDKQMLFGAYNRGLFKDNRSEILQINLETRSPFTIPENINKTYMGAAKNSKGDVYLPLRDRILKWDRDNNIEVTPLKGTPQMITKDSNSDTLFAAFKGGLLLIYPDDNYKELTKEVGFEPYQNESVAKDKYGNYWLGASQKDFLQIYNGKTVKKWHGDKAKNIISLASDYKGNIWMGNHNGLYLYNHKEELKFAPEIVKCPVYNIISYTDSLIFLGTPQELFMINTKDFYEKGIETVNRYSYEVGFTAEGVIQNSYCIDHKGDIWIPATNYSYKIHPNKLKLADKLFVPTITSVKYSSNKRELHEIDLDTNFKNKELPLGTKYLNFEFKYINYNKRNQLLYRYRLNGYNNSWFLPTDESKINFDNISPGTYCLEVQASIKKDEWSSSSFSPTIKIPPYLWQILWVKLLLLLIVITASVLLLKWFFDRKRNRALDKQYQELKISKLELINIKNQLNPHFIFNMLNSISYSIFKLEKDLAYSLISKLSKLIRRTLDNSDIAINTLQEEINFVEDYLQLQKYRFNERLTYKIDLDNSVNRNRKIPKMIVQILVENAVHHGIEKREKGGSIYIKILEDKEKLLIIVEDSGVGFDTSTLVNNIGTGINSIEKILTFYNKKNRYKSSFRIYSVPMQQTKAIIEIPLKYKFHFISTKE